MILDLSLKISVVTISFNQADFLRQCIDSVLNQSYRNIEYIVVDPGSTDGSREIIDSYGSQIIKIYENDHGPAHGLNKGFAIASGDIFCFINSDDFFLSGAFEHASLFFYKDSKLDVLLGAGIEVNEDGIEQRAFYPSHVSKKAYVNGAVTFFQQGMFFKSEIFKKCNGFNPDNKSCWDGELFLSFILNRARFKRSMNKFAAFRIYPTSITGSQRLINIYEADHNYMYESVYGKLKSPSLVSKAWYRIIKLLIDPKYIFFRMFKSR